MENNENLMHYLNHRLNLFPEIYQEFNRLIKNQSKIISAELISAEKMIDEQIEQIKSIISKKYPDKTIEIIEKINKNLIGGFQIKIDSVIIDASTKNEISLINEKIIKTLN
jgi:F-type H+-transporting ATPase subunit delta